MPNWIEGTLHLRGKVKDIHRFLKEGISKNGSMLDKDIRETIVDNSSPEEGVVSFEFMNDQFMNDPWVVDTQRAFLNNQYVAIPYKDENEETSISLGVRQAWSFKVNNWIALSKKYNIDIRLNGFECGMRFGQEITILRGDPEPTVDEEVLKYNDWEWECPFPNMGG